MPDKNNIEKVNKIDAAIRLTNQAIKMFFHKEDTVSIHLLINAANEILSTILKKKGVKTQLGVNSILIKNEMRKDWIKRRREEYNFFKHANNDADKTLDFNVSFNKFFLLENINFIHLLEIPLSKEMTFFTFWLINQNPNILERSEFLDSELKKLNMSSEELFKLFDEVMESDKTKLNAIKKIFQPV